MTTRKKQKRQILSYSHEGKKRANNPPVGLVNPNTDSDKGEKRTYSYDPHIDPQLQWAGKAEHTSFEVPTQSLHVHERIDPRTIMEAVRRRNGNGSGGQASMFEAMREIPLRQEIEFYKHSNDWSNRMIAGDSLLVMNSLLQKENMSGKVQCVYIDPPYGIKYGSNFQPFVNKRDVKDGKDEDLTAEPEMIKAFRDTWELGIHSYLSYMRDRLLLARELLTDSGSVFVQISDENVHHVREIMDEVFGAENFVSLIILKTRATSTSKEIETINDYIVWYAKDKSQVMFRRLYTIQDNDPARFNMADVGGKTISRKNVAPNDMKNARFFASDKLISTSGGQGSRGFFEFDGKKYTPSPQRGWRCSVDGLHRLAEQGRIFRSGSTQSDKVSIRYKYFYDDFPYITVKNVWDEQISEQNKSYVVQTAEKAIQRCILMATDPGDLVFDPTCGSGTTAYVAEAMGQTLDNLRHLPSSPYPCQTTPHDGNLRLLQISLSR